MKEHNPYISHLFQKYLEGSYSEEDLDTLLAYFKLDEDSEQLRELIEQQFDRPIPEAVDQQEVESRVVRIGAELEQKINPPVKIKRFKWWYAAASIVLLLSIGTITYLSIKNERQSNHILSQYGDDVLPGKNRAYITLSDGKRITLDSSQTIVANKDGQLLYGDGQQIDAVETEYATISTPVGGEYQIILADGTKAWLNAASSIKYPISFVGNNREIEVQGEVYLEVTANKEKPFIVQSEGQRIQVLGTAFNIRNYDVKTITTLVHGKIALTNKHSNQEQILVPGQQASVSGDGIRVSPVDPADFTAWKDGYIQVKDANLLQICKELERWYDVKFVLPRNFDNRDKAFLSFDRNVLLSTILLSLEKTYGVQFSITGKEVRIR